MMNIKNNIRFRGLIILLSYFVLSLLVISYVHRDYVVTEQYLDPRVTLMHQQCEWIKTEILNGNYHKPRSQYSLSAVFENPDLKNVQVNKVNST